MRRWRLLAAALVAAGTARAMPGDGIHPLERAPFRVDFTASDVLFPDLPAKAVPLHRDPDLSSRIVGRRRLKTAPDRATSVAVLSEVHEATETFTWRGGSFAWADALPFSELQKAEFQDDVHVGDGEQYDLLLRLPDGVCAYRFKERTYAGNCLSDDEMGPLVRGGRQEWWYHDPDTGGWYAGSAPPPSAPSEKAPQP